MPANGPVLHITPWYPTVDDPMHAIWIRRQVEVMGDGAQAHVLHITFATGGFGRTVTEEEGVTRMALHFPFGSWRIREWLYGLAIRQFLRRHRGYTHVNFFIAYPSCVHWHLFKRWLPARVSITEHWSAYHFHFHSRRPLARVKKIFSRQVPVLAVSDALLNDIQQFSGCNFPAAVVYNVVDTAVFHPTEVQPVPLSFFMVSYWKSPKEPLEIMRAVLSLHREGVAVRLRIAGYGPQWDDIQALSASDDARACITLLGPLNAADIAAEMNAADGFIHPTGYETFSVVVAEALCCGCPVLSNRKGALPERIHHGNGCLRGGGETYRDLLLRYLNGPKFNRTEIARQAAQLYSKGAVSAQFRRALDTIFAKP